MLCKKWRKLETMLTQRRSFGCLLNGNAYSIAMLETMFTQRRSYLHSRAKTRDITYKNRQQNIQISVQFF